MLVQYGAQLKNRILWIAQDRRSGPAVAHWMGDNMRMTVLVAVLALGGLLATPASALDSRGTRLYDQITELGISKPIAEWLAEEAAKARVSAIRVGKIRDYGRSDSTGKITIQNSAGGRSIRNLTHEIAHIGAGVAGGHDCRWIRYLTAMAGRFEAKFGRGRGWNTSSLESYYPRYRLDRCKR